MTARTRVIAWKLVKLSGEECIKGLANQAGAVTTVVLGLLVVTHVLGLDPADAVRRILGNTHIGKCLTSILRDGPPTESVDRFRVLG
ncbi:hypothetical protein [Streptomyces sp. NPDC055642]